MKLRITTALFLAATSLSAPVTAEVSGPYLAARQASINADYTEAVRYYSRAVVQDPSNVALLQNAIIANLGAGDVETAARIGNTYKDAGGDNPIVTLVRNIAALKAGDFGPAAEGSTPGDGLGALIDGLLSGWAHMGLGNMADVNATFSRVAETADFAALAHYHQALALAQVGDFEAADEILSGERHGSLSLSVRGVEAHAQVLVQLDRPDDALALLGAALIGGFSPELEALRDRIAGDQAVVYTFATTPQEGAAEVLFTTAVILQGRAAPQDVLVYSRLANFLRPDHAQSAILSAELLDDLGQYNLAQAAFAQVPSSHPTFFFAELGRANALNTAGREDTAIEVLQALSRAYPDRPRVHAALGDYLGRQDRDAEAIIAYTKSLALSGDDDRMAWRTYYARGIVHERLDDFAAMEADFRKALELQPNQPDVLNYLGYSLVEQRSKLDEALAMIETAVAERPESGYITDSLAWVYYRLGRYEEAVAPMEKAVQLLPVDPIINDHLGDVYWKVGRFREAEFQWKRALSFDPEEDEAARIQRKLEVGLDVVLEDEAEISGN